MRSSVKILMGIVGTAAAVVLYLFVMEIKEELEEERKWRERGR